MENYFKRTKKYGIEFKLNTTISEIIGSSKVENVQFSDGTTVELNLVVLNGIIPNTALAVEANLETKKELLLMIS